MSVMITRPSRYALKRKTDGSLVGTYSAFDTAVQAAETAGSGDYTIATSLANLKVSEGATIPVAPVPLPPISMPTGRPAAPSNLTVIGRTGTTIELKCDPVDGATGYQFAIRHSVLGDWTPSSIVEVPRRLFEHLERGVTYSFSVVAINEAGVSPPSAFALESTASF